jgi:glycosyltransferase involved in cell wall biosynthesis
MSISVALCTHNGAAFLREQLASILAQTLLPDEIVISDDASTDSTLEIIESEVASFRSANGDAAPNVTVLRNETPLGVSANFERAILACSSELVALCDQDDVWEPGRLARALTLFGGRPELLLIHGDAILIDGNGAELGETLFEALEVDAKLRAQVHSGGAFELLLHRNIVTGATAVVRRELAALAAPFPAAWLHDEWLAIIAAATGAIDLTSERLVRYRQHGDNQLGARKLSVVGKLGRMFEPGYERNLRLVRRATALAERVPLIDGVSSRRIEATHRKLLHERVRSELNPSRLRRVVPVLRELRTGRYGEFGRGAADAVRDLLQPLKHAG